MTPQVRSTLIPRMAAPSADTLVVVLVHGIAAAHRDEFHGLDGCDPSENLLDVLVNNTSVLELGKSLPDPTRIVDLYVFHRLLLASRWCVPIPLHRLSDTMTDPATFVFAHDLIRRGHEDFTSNDLKNSIKRIRAVLRLIAPTPRDWFIRYEGRRGYLVDLTHLTIHIVHLPQ